MRETTLCKFLGSLALLVLVGITSAKQLPTQGIAWREGLRDYLATLPESAFNLPATPPDLTPLPLDPNAANIAPILRDQLSMYTYGTDPAGPALWIPGKCYTLAHMEMTATGTTYYPAGAVAADDVVQPMEYMGSGHQVKLAQIAYAGNPYYTNLSYTAALKHRTVAAMALDLIMTAEAYDTNTDTARVATNIGSLLSNATYDYKIAKDIIPPAVQVHFENAFKEMVDRIASLGPYNQQYNRICQVFPGMYWAWEITQDPAVYNKYANFVSTGYSACFSPAGYFPDESNGYDASYNGYNSYFTARLARSAPNDPVVQQYVIPGLREMWRLNNYLTLYDADRLKYSGYPVPHSPNEFNSRTGGTVINRGGLYPNQAVDAAVLGLDEPLAYLYNQDPNFDDPATVYATARIGINSINARMADDRYRPGGDAGPTRKWAPYWFAYYRMNTAADNMGIYDIPGIGQRAASNPDLKLYPFQRSDSYIEVRGDEFVMAKFGDLAAVVHCGRVSSLERWYNKWDADDPNQGRPAGFGGGELAAFWTPDAGIAILGMQKSNYSIDDARHFSTTNWDNWRSWPIHAVNLLTTPNSYSPEVPRPEEAKWTSSARIQNPDRAIVPIYDDLQEYQLWDALNQYRVVWNDGDPGGQKTAGGTIETNPVSKTPVDTSTTKASDTLSKDTATKTGDAGAKAIGGGGGSHTPPNAVAIYVHGEIPRTNLRFGRNDDGIRVPFIKDKIIYTRSFLLSKHKVLVETTVNATDGTDRFNEAYESIPLFLGDLLSQMDAPIRSGWPTNLEPLEIQVNSLGGAVQADNGTPNFIDNVTSIAVKRFDGTIVIDFMQPQRVRVVNWIWSFWTGDPTVGNLSYNPNVNDNLTQYSPTFDAYPVKRRKSSRNILIDLLHGQSNVALPATTVQYTIRRLNPLVGGGSGGGSGGSSGGGGSQGSTGGGGSN